LILATNQEPRFADRSKGIWRRMMVVPFNKSIPRERQDTRLAAKLKEELPGIFNWSMEGLRQLRAAGQFTVSQVCEEAWDRVRRESNPAREYLLETFEQGQECDVTACATAYAGYVEWCAERALKPLDGTNFGKEVRKAFPAVERRRESTGERLWRYHGLRAGSPSKGETEGEPSMMA
jgi:putative DNA primase/helicase